MFPTTETFGCKHMECNCVITAVPLITLFITSTLLKDKVHAEISFSSPNPKGIEYKKVRQEPSPSPAKRRHQGG